MKDSTEAFKIIISECQKFEGTAFDIDEVKEALKILKNALETVNPDKQYPNVKI